MTSILGQFWASVTTSKPLQSMTTVSSERASANAGAPSKGHPGLEGSRTVGQEEGF